MVARRWGGVWVDGNGDPATIVVNEDGTAVGGVSSASITPGEEHIGQVGGSTVSLYVVPTITAGAYSAGDVVGGEITLTNAMRVSSGTGLLMSISIVDLGNQKAALDLLLFDSNPSNGQADNAAYAWNAADPALLLAHIPIAASDYTTVGGEAVCTLLTGGIPVQANGSMDLYLIVVTAAASTPTYTSTTDLRFRFGFTRD